MPFSSFSPHDTSATVADKENGPPLRVATLAGGRQYLHSHAARFPVLRDLPPCAPLGGLVLQAPCLFDDMLQMISHLQVFRAKKDVLLSNQAGSKNCQGAVQSHGMGENESKKAMARLSHSKIVRTIDGGRPDPRVSWRRDTWVFNGNPSCPESLNVQNKIGASHQHKGISQSSYHSYS